LRSRHRARHGAWRGPCERIISLVRTGNLRLCAGTAVTTARLLTLLHRVEEFASTFWAHTLSSLVQAWTTTQNFVDSRTSFPPELEENRLRRSPIFSRNFQTFGGLREPSRRRNLSPLMSPGPILECRTQRRAAVRYKLRLPVIFHWNDGTERTEGGFTNDVAMDGALIFSTKCPPIGSEVRIEVLLPSPDQSSEELRIECVGKVTRVVEEAGCFGVLGMFDDDHLTRTALA